jgi:hypothetical protein
MTAIKVLSHLLLLPVLAVSFTGTVAADSPKSLDQEFQVPPRQARPWVFWVWMDADIPRAAITRDLEQMKDKGITGCILYDCGPGNCGPGNTLWNQTIARIGKDYRPVPTDQYKGSHMTTVPGTPVATWTPQWRKLVCFSAKEAGRLGIDFVVSAGLANTSGHIAEEYREQKLVWSETNVRGAQTFDGPLPEPLTDQGKHYPFHRDVAVLAVPNRPGYSVHEVIDLSSKMDATGHLQWDVPAGDWKIIRLLQVPTGITNIWGYFNDSMSAEAMDKTWAVTMAPLLAEMSPAERKAVKGIEDDSWEAGKIGWTKLFPEEFKKRRGYDLIPYLPIIAGEKMSDPDTRRRILRDYALTISDLIADDHYAHLKKIANDNGLFFYSEAAGPNYDQADLLKTSSRVDKAMAEFWMPSAHRAGMDSRFLLRNAASANHIYGNTITMCESFTSLGTEWEVTPFTMKPVADQAFCDGLNKICVHNFSQSPSLTARPGYVYVAGTHYDPGVTWWDETGAFNTYLARCSFMLQQGKFVADALFYHGDNIGHGEQRKTIPPTLGEGYDHDNCNSEVLLTRMSTKDGRIVLTDGMSYRVLVLPDAQPMPLADLQKIAALVAGGATIIGPPPAGVSGMLLNPDDQAQFNSLVEQLWSGLDGTKVTEKIVGAGHVFRGRTVRQVLAAEDTPPDFEETGLSKEGTIDWIHRATKSTDIYYVASRWERPEKVACSFRVSGRQPELWDPVTGDIRDAADFRQENGRTIVPLEFGSYGSVFVVFRKPILMDAAGPAASNYPATQLLETLSGPWTINFDPKWGGPAKVVFDELVDWTNRPEPGIKYYSGTAVYHKRFDVPTLPPGARYILDLGELHELARVRLNGHDLGVVWNKPARLDITGEINSEKNDLELAVVNLWPNRLKRDESLPMKKRLTKTNIHKFTAASPLLPSGLIGPVNVLALESPQ